MPGPMGIETSVGPSGGVTYDTDALNYFDRAENLGGSFDQTAINATYTEGYVKSAISQFVRGCKTDAIWDKLTEVYLLAGVSFGGLMAKLKLTHAGTATLTNTNFVTGDYVGAGSGGGLIGNGSNKSLDSLQTIPGAQVRTLSFGAYASGLTSNSLIGSRRGSVVVKVGDGAGLHMHFGGSGRVNFVSPTALGFFHGYSTASDVRVFKDGVFNAAKGSAGTYTGILNTWKLFQTGADSEFSVARIQFGYYGVADWADADMTNLGTRTNTLMTALGANVY